MGEREAAAGFKRCEEETLIFGEEFQTNHEKHSSTEDEQAKIVEGFLRNEPSNPPEPDSSFKAAKSL